MKTNEKDIEMPRDSPDTRLASSQIFPSKVATNASLNKATLSKTNRKCDKQNNYEP